MATEVEATRRADRLVRHPRRVRWFHAGIYLLTIPLIWTGWWLLVGEEGHPSLLARAFGIADVRLHVWAGRIFALLALGVIVFGRRGIRTFVRETFRSDPGDARWWVRWPRAILTGGFARHEGTFDPGQRVANVLIVGGLIVSDGDRHRSDRAARRSRVRMAREDPPVDRRGREPGDPRPRARRDRRAPRLPGRVAFDASRRPRSGGDRSARVAGVDRAGSFGPAGRRGYAGGLKPLPPSPKKRVGRFRAATCMSCETRAVSTW